MSTDDPFFSLTSDCEWNACIGRQAGEENYADGFIDAAIELTTAVLGKHLYEKRDTLVLPILYNARHAIELTLKLVIGELVRTGILKSGHPKNHDIASHLAFLDAAAIPDELLRGQLAEIRPFIDSLAQIDDDGQELRFHETRDGKRSMDTKALANIKVIHRSLGALQEVLNNLKYRCYSLCNEWKTGSRTTHCSRRDLSEIARLLPKRSDWATQAFSDCKQLTKERYSLSNKQFCLVLDKIQATRGLSGLLGIESPLIHLSDAKAAWLLAKWDELHPPRTENDDLGIDYFRRDFDKVFQDRKARDTVHAAIAQELSEEEFADAESIFYLARDKVFPEFYEDRLKLKKAEYNARKDYRQEIYDLMSKTNFRRHFVEGLRNVGRLELADRLEKG